MAEQTYTDIPRYRYKLNENAVADSECLEGLHLSKFWKDSFEYERRLEPYLRTVNNPKGKVDYEKYIPSKAQTIYSSEKQSKTEPIIMDYTQLATLTRKELEEVALSWGLSTQGKKSDFLIKRITELTKDKVKVKEEIVKIEKELTEEQ